MSPSPSCPKCGKPLPADAPSGLCPKCLVQAGLASGPQAGPAATATSPASSHFEPPHVEDLARRFPQLEILELVGQGGMGAVYKARQLGLDRLVAVKILPPEVGRDASFAERFVREARALARLNHPNIVAVHDFGQAGELFYFVMEYIDGANLRQAMRAGQLEPSEALAVVPQICDALQYAHDEGVVHRDVKPENILLDKRGRVKIADFGLSKLVAGGGRELPDLSLTGTHQVMGTVRYMAPEQLEGAKAVDHRADIYSLGVVFYEMLTGELPLGRFAPPSQKVEIDVRLDEVVLRTLEKEPQRRYQQASEVKTDLQTIAGGLYQSASRSHPGAIPTAPSGKSLEQPRPDAHRAVPPPWPFWIWATFVWLLGWILTAALWNFREQGLAVAAVAMVAIGYCVVRWSVSYVPAIREAQRRGGILWRIFNLGVALAMFALGHLVLIAAHGPILDRPWMLGSAAQDPSKFMAHHQGKEHYLIRELAAFREEIPRVELVGQGAYFEMLWSTASGLALCGCILIAGAAACMLDLPTYRRPWGLYLRMICAHTVVILGALGLAHLLVGFADMAQVERRADGSLFIGGGASMSGVRRELRSKATSEQVTARVKTWMESHGFRLTYRSEWQLDTVPAGKTVAYVRVMGGKKASSFDAYRITWRGLRRVAPYLDVQCVSSASPVESIVKIDAGLARAGSGEAERWAPFLDSLEQEIKSLDPK